jgi:DNA-binding LytR/AlgR family response regulator
MAVLGGTVVHLYFGAIAMFGFALIVLAAAIQSMRGITPARMPLAVVAVIYTVFGVMAFSTSHNPHHLGPLLMGVLLGAALVVPGSGRSPARGAA